MKPGSKHKQALSLNWSSGDLEKKFQDLVVGIGDNAHENIFVVVVQKTTWRLKQFTFLFFFLYWPHQEFSTAGSLLLNLLTQKPWKAGQTDLHLLTEVLQISAYAALHALREKRIVLYYLKSNKVKKNVFKPFECVHASAQSFSTLSLWDGIS